VPRLLGFSVVDCDVELVVAPLDVDVVADVEVFVVACEDCWLPLLLWFMVDAALDACDSPA